MVRESRLESTEHGLVPKGDGWFVLNAREARWLHAPGRSAICEFEGAFEGEQDFLQLGINLNVLEPGVSMGMYHWEADQEDFLVLAGEAVLIVEGEERPLRQWDFVHCPAGTKHIIVGAGAGPSLVLAVGARDRSTGPDWGGYSVDDAALRHDAGVEQETTDAKQAYAGFARREPTRYRDGWLLDTPPGPSLARVVQGLRRAARGAAGDDPVIARPAARAEVVVEASPDEAFRIFTDEIGLWWRRDTPYWNDRERGLTIRIEPRVGGHFLEVYDLESGTGLEVGRVTAWEPGERVAMTWTQVGWPEGVSTDIEVTFEPVDDGTLVRLEQTGFERVPDAEAYLPGYDAGWKEVLGWYADHTLKKEQA